MRESPPSKSRLSCSRLLAPRMQSGLHRSSRPSLQSCAPASSPTPTNPVGLGLHSLFRLQGTGGGMDQSRRPQPGPFPPAAAVIWRLRACPALALRAWVNSGRALPLQSLSACRAVQPGEERTEARASSFCLKIAEQATPTADIPCVLCFHRLLTFGYRTWRMWSALRHLLFPRAWMPTVIRTLRTSTAAGSSETSGAETLNPSPRLRFIDPHGQLPGQAGTFAIIPSRRARRPVGEASEPPANSVPSSSLPDSARPSCPRCPSTQTC